MVSESALIEFLRKNAPAKKFVPYCYVNKQADALTVYFEGDADYSKRLNDHVTLYLSLETHEVIGCRIKGISGILADLPNYINVTHGEVELSVVFLAFRGGAEEDVSSAMNSLARVASERNMVLQQQV
jgi:hypothetical protein